MKRRTAGIWLLCLLATSVGLIAGLYHLSDYLKHQQGSFIRIYPPHPVLPQGGAALANVDFYVAGISNQSIYLARIQTPLHLIVMDATTFDTTTVELHVPDVNAIKTYGTTVKIDSPNFYLTDGAIPFVYQGSVNDWNASKLIYDSTYFLDFTPMNSASLAIRSYNSQAGINILGKISERQPFHFFKPSLLEKQVDGFFCTDGILNYDRSSDNLVYVYYYRNQFIVTDSTLNLKFKAHTIDTFSHARIKMAVLNRAGYKSNRLAVPPPFVNKNSCVYGNYLFVQSAVPAKNENLKRFQRASVIDVYTLTSGEYKFSFYLYDENNEKLKSFHVKGKNLFAIYDHYIGKFQLNPHSFSP